MKESGLAHEQIRSAASCDSYYADRAAVFAAPFDKMFSVDEYVGVLVTKCH